ncbi:hypothetical protein HYH02_014188 [Chlamydomonas schloesseri]|uniref:Importin N-terminal domain-containing protein n=1 Tax=Chlamydomonas schloesseri TaxID=2026947 RepID=A0A835ST29_9CHLO|nr:hypothetical protein HYH02_014188 [Chlamydomonas schloesseri]|eukprot:KAG2429153.1 hypothetical protein HYH02_014188 [Chlamydomonas schloesseri]
MAAISDPTRLVLQSILASQSPQALPQQRKDAVALLEQFKRADVSSLLPVCGALVSVGQLAGLAAQYGVMLGPADVVGVRLAAFQLLTDVARNRWRELNPDQRMAATRLAWQEFTEAVAPPGGGADGAGAAGGSYPLRGKSAELLAVVVRQQGSAAYAEILPQLMTGAAAGPSQAELSCRVLHYISEDLTQFEVNGPDSTPRPRAG